MSRAGKATVTEAQIAAAGSLHSSLAQWQATDHALMRLQDAMPGFGPAETLLKVVAVNALYYTNVLAFVRAAAHVQTVLASADLATVGAALVESLASIPTTANGRPRRYVSFASKFAHFFVNAERFPIYDSYAERMLRLHLGPSALRNPARPYEAFVTNINRLMSECGLKCSYRELDRYLWVAGQYHAWTAGKRGLNTELSQLFANPSADQRTLLGTIS